MWYIGCRVCLSAYSIPHDICFQVLLRLGLESRNYYISKCCKIINGNYKRITNFNEKIQKKIKTLGKQEQSAEQSKKVNNYNEYIQHEL